MKGFVVHSVIFFFLSSWVMEIKHLAFIAIFTFIRVRILLLLLCLLLLDANNYDSWSRSMLTALSAKNKVEFVDGSAPQPSSSNPLFSAWRRATIWWFLGLYIQSPFLFVIAFYGWIMLMKFGRI